METQAKSHLAVLHQDAKKDFSRMGKGIVKSVFATPQPSDLKNAYLAISKVQGEKLYNIIIENNCKHIVEFGTSFGISTIYFAEAARVTGGKVITTELIESKAKTAAINFEKAGVSELIEIRIGDAIASLKNYDKKIDFLFLDGWKDLYLPLLKQLEPNFKSGTLIYADNMNFKSTKAYADYILQKQDKYTTQIVDDGKGFLSIVA
ncbi:MAG: O-methyltransferase [Saprospiraceae bacterium]